MLKKGITTFCQEIRILNIIVMHTVSVALCLPSVPLLSCHCSSPICSVGFCNNLHIFLHSGLMFITQSYIFARFGAGCIASKWILHVLCGNKHKGNGTRNCHFVILHVVYLSVCFKGTEHLLVIVKDQYSHLVYPIISIK